VITILYRPTAASSHLYTRAYLEFLERVYAFIVELTVLAHHITSSALHISFAANHAARSCSLLPVTPHISQPLYQRHIICPRSSQLVLRCLQLPSCSCKLQLELLHSLLEPIPLPDQHAQHMAVTAAAAIFVSRCQRAREAAAACRKEA
jgi:hypothetical protein